MNDKRISAVAVFPAGGRGVQPIASTKFVPPRTALRLMPRQELLERLLGARRQRCVMIQGPAGSGKTSTLVAWRQALLTLDYDVAWISLTSEDNDLAQFFDCLLNSLGGVDAAAVREAMLLVGGDANDSTAIEHRVIALVRGLANRPRELTLMLDDLQQLDDASVLQTLQWLIDYAPSTLHVVLASRSVLPQPLSTTLARLRDQNLTAMFDLRDLRFSAAECERFLSEQLGHVDKRDAVALHELTDGWVAGLQLFALDMKSKAGEVFLPVPLRDARAFARYFEDEVLVRVSADDLDLLMRVAICNRFCAPLCASLMDRPQGLTRMMMRLTQIDGSNLFIARVQGRDYEAWYRLHPLLREVLMARVAEAPIDEQRELHRRAWHWFEAHGHVDEAVRHAVQAGEFVAAAAIVERSARDLLTQGEYGRMMALVRRLPQQNVDASVGLRTALAHVHLYARELGALERDIEALAALPLDTRQGAELALLRGGLALQRDDVDGALQLLPELDSWPADADEFMDLARTNFLAWVHMAHGDFALARSILEESAARQSGLAASLTVGFLAGLVHSLEGRMVDAERLYRKVLQVAEQQGATFVGVSNMASALLGDVLYELNDVEAACQLLDARIDLIEHSAIPEAMLRTAIVLASGHWVSGRRLEAIAQLDRLEDYAGAHRLDRLKAHALCLRVRLQQRGDSRAAAEALSQLQELAARHAALGDTVSFEIGLLAGRAQVATSLHCGDFDAAARTLDRLVASAESASRLRPVVAMRLQLGLVEQSRGRPDAATSHLVAALRMGHRLGLIRTLLDASRRVPGAVLALQKQGLLDPVLSFYVDRLLQGAAKTWLVTRPLAKHSAPFAPSEPLKERELEILRLLAQALPNKKIARVIGLSPDTVKWHLKNVYAKLGVGARDEAVARARDLGL